MITTILFAPAIPVYMLGERGRGKPVLPHLHDKLIAAVVIVVAILSLYLPALRRLSRTAASFIAWYAD